MIIDINDGKRRNSRRGRKPYSRKRKTARRRRRSSSKGYKYSRNMLGLGECEGKTKNACYSDPNCKVTKRGCKDSNNWKQGGPIAYGPTMPSWGGSYKNDPDSDVSSVSSFSTVSSKPESVTIRSINSWEETPEQYEKFVQAQRDMAKAMGIPVKIWKNEVQAFVDGVRHKYMKRKASKKRKGSKKSSKKRKGTKGTKSKRRKGTKSKRRKGTKKSSKRRIRGKGSKSARRIRQNAAKNSRV